MPNRNPMRTWHKVVIGGAVAVGVTAVVASVIWANTKPRPISAPVPTEDDAIDAALEQLGAEAETPAVAQVAYYTAYPEAPTPPVGAYAVAWNRIVKKVQAVLGREEVPVVAPVIEDVDDTAEIVGAWLASLTAQQVAATRTILGGGVWDPITAAVDRGDDHATRAALLTLKLGIEQAAKESKLGALKMYSELKGALGPKLDEFTKILSQTVGKPEVL